jgi:hypothetical protein
MENAGDIRVFTSRLSCLLTTVLSIQANERWRALNSGQ